MIFRKVCCWILLVSASLLGCSKIISSMTKQGGRLYSDGGPPQPPFPPKATPKPALNLVADGGAPQPPFPPKATPKPTPHLRTYRRGAPTAFPKRTILQKKAHLGKCRRPCAVPLPYLLISWNR